jgi:hypothetical protein
MFESNLRFSVPLDPFALIQRVRAILDAEPVPNLPEKALGGASFASETGGWEAISSVGAVAVSIRFGSNSGFACSGKFSRE